MATTTYNNGLAYRQTQVGGELDDVIVVQSIALLPGGMSLDITDWTKTDDSQTIPGGWILIQNTTDKTVKPLPQSTTGTWDSLPSGYQYLGILRNTMSLIDPRAAILVNGVVNGEALQTATGAPITTDIKTALPHIQFLYV
jgi:hypothetical protein